MHFRRLCHDSQSRGMYNSRSVLLIRSKHLDMSRGNEPWVVSHFENWHAPYGAKIWLWFTYERALPHRHTTDYDQKVVRRVPALSKALKHTTRLRISIRGRYWILSRGTSSHFSLWKCSTLSKAVVLLHLRKVDYMSMGEGLSYGISVSQLEWWMVRKKKRYESVFWI